MALTQPERTAANAMLRMQASGINAYTRPAAIQAYPMSSSGIPKVYTPGLSYPEQRPSGWYSPPPTLTLNPTAGRGYGSPRRKNRRGKKTRKGRKGYKARRATRRF